MMEAADLRNADDLGRRRGWALSGPALRRIPQPRVDSVFVVVLDVFPEKTAKVILIQHDHVIEQFSAYAPEGAEVPRWGLLLSSLPIGGREYAP